jgi:magnesium-transporting ATPase (P-type)
VVGSPYLQLMQLGIGVQYKPYNHFSAFIMNMFRLIFPIWFAVLLVKFAFRIGVKKKRDRCSHPPPAHPTLFSSVRFFFFFLFLFFVFCFFFFFCFFFLFSLGQEEAGQVLRLGVTRSSGRRKGEKLTTQLAWRCTIFIWNHAIKRLSCSM